MILVSELRKLSWRPHWSTHGVKASHGCIMRSFLKIRTILFYHQVPKQKQKQNPKQNQTTTKLKPGGFKLKRSLKA